MMIGDRLKERRNQKGLTQMQLAKLIGGSQSLIAQLETGNSKSANAENLLKIAAALETNPNWLLTGKGDPDLASFSPSDTDISSLANNLSPAKKAAWVAVGMALLNAK